LAPDLTCENRTRQAPPDGGLIPSNQQVAGSSPARGATEDQLSGAALDPTASGNGHRTSSALSLAVAQDRTTGADQDPAATAAARQRVRALVARERSGGPKVTAAEVIAVIGRSRRRAYELLRDARTEQE
jgi:hypothetical protein